MRIRRRQAGENGNDSVFTPEKQREAAPVLFFLSLTLLLLRLLLALLHCKLQPVLVLLLLVLVLLLWN
jgi:hypothetical protein